MGLTRTMTAVDESNLDAFGIEDGSLMNSWMWNQTYLQQEVNNSLWMNYIPNDEETVKCSCLKSLHGFRILEQDCSNQNGALCINIGLWKFCIFNLF